MKLASNLHVPKGIRILGPTDTRVAKKTSLLAFAIPARDPIEALRVLDGRGVGMRGGDLAALPLPNRFGFQ